MSQISCDTIGPLLSAFVDGEVDASERQRIEEHTSCCSVCASHLGFLQALHRAPGVPVRVAPPLDMAEIVARATYAKPTWQERLGLWLRPAPVRVGLAGAFVAVFGVTLYQRMPSPVMHPVVADVVAPAPVSPTAPPVASGLIDPGAREIETPPAPPPVAPTPVRTASAPRTVEAPRSTPHVPRPDVRIERASFRRSASEPSTQVASGAVGQHNVAPASRTTEATVSVAPAAATRTVAPSVSDSVPTAAPTPAPPLQVARATTGAHELAQDDDDSDARASYEAGLLAQSESSRRRIGSASNAGGTLLSVVRAPVTTSNH